MRNVLRESEFEYNRWNTFRGSLNETQRDRGHETAKRDR